MYTNFQRIVGMTLFGFLVLECSAANAGLREDLIPNHGRLWLAASDNDVTVTRKVLTSQNVMDSKGKPFFELSDQVADIFVEWLRANWNSDAFVELLPVYVTFAVGSAKGPPLAAGTIGSPRYKILQALEEALGKRASPAALAALLVFSDVDDAALRQVARGADYSALKAYSWLLYDVPWANLFIEGLNPDHVHNSDPTYPLVTPSAKAGILTWANKLLLTIPFVRPYKFYYGFVGPPLLNAKSLLRFGLNRQLDPASPEAANSISQWSDMTDQIVTESLAALGNAEVIEAWNNTKPDYFHGVLFNPLLGSSVGLTQVESMTRTASSAIAYGNMGDKFPIEMQDVGGPSHSLGRFLTYRAWERRSLVLLALYAARSQGATFDNPDLRTVDSAFEKVIIGDPARWKNRTTVVDSIDLGPLQKMANNLQSSKCSIGSLTLDTRQVSFNSGQYAEIFETTCGAGAVLPVPVVGTIPAWLYSALQHHPRLLDVLGESLASIQYLAPTPGSLSHSDFELIAGLPDKAAEHLLAELWTTNSNWQFVREGILLNMEDDLTVFFDSPLPSPDPANILFGEHDIAANNAEYDATVNAYASDLQSYLMYVSGSNILAKISPVINALPDKVETCFETHDSSGSGENCSSGSNQMKRTLLGALSTQQSSLSSIRKSLPMLVSNLNNDKCLGNIPGGATAANILMSPDLLKYFVRYTYIDQVTHENCNYFFSTAAKIDDQVRKMLQGALTRDPYFLRRYGLDLVPSGSGTTARLQAALANEASEGTRFQQGYTALWRAGTLPWLSSPRHLYPTLTQKRGGGVATELLGGGGYQLATPGEYSSPGQLNVSAVTISSISTQNLFSTSEGIRLASALHGASSVFTQTRPDDVLGIPDTLQNKFADSLHDYLGNVLKSAKAQTDKKCAQLLDAIHDAQQSQHPWSFGITIGWGVGGLFAGSISYSIDNVSVQLGLSFPDNNPIIIPGWNGISLPIQSSAIFPPPDLTSHVGDVPKVAPADTGKLKMLKVSRMMPLAQVSDVAVVTVPWTQVPPVAWDPAELTASQNAGRAYLANLIGRSWPALTDAERTEILDALKQPMFPRGLADLVASKADKGYQVLKIEDGDWYQTTIVPQLVPTQQPGSPCPAAGCVSGTKAIDLYIEEENQSFGVQFNAAKQGAIEGGHAVGGKVFREGMPGVRLTFGNNFTIMQETLIYPLADGSGTISLLHTMRTPVWVVDRIRKDPFGHQFEKWGDAVVGAAADGAANWPADAPSKSTYLKAQQPVIEQIGDEIAFASKSTDPVFGEFAKQMDDAFAQLWKSWALFSSSQGTALNSQDAYVPPDYGTPYLNFFQAPWEYVSDGSEGIDWLIYKGGSGLSPDQVESHLPPLP